MFELLSVTFESSTCAYKRSFTCSCLHRQLRKMNFCQVKASFLSNWAVTEANAACWLDSSSFGWVHMKTQKVWCCTQRRKLNPRQKQSSSSFYSCVSPQSLFLPYLPSTHRILRRFFSSTCVTSPLSPQGLMEQLLFSSGLFPTRINSGLSGLTPSVVLPCRSR